MSHLARSSAPSSPQASSDVTQLLVAAGLLLLAGASALVALPLVTGAPRLLPVAIIGGALAVILLLRPAWTLPVLIAVTYTSIGSSFFGGLPSPIEVGALVFVVIAAWRSTQRLAEASEALLVSCLLALPLVASALLNPSTLPELYDIVKRLAFLPVVALCLTGRADVERAITALVVVGLILGTGAVYSVLVGPTALFPVTGEEGLEAPRAAGPFGEPTFFALSLAVLAPLALLFIANGGHKRLLGYAAMLALTGGVIAAGSRGALLAIVVAVVAFALAGEGRRLRGAAVVLVVAIAAMVPLFSAQAASSAERTISGRVTENLVSLAMFGDHPILGVGPGGYPELYRDYSRHIGDDPRVGRFPHSLPLEVAAEQGVVGLAGWLLALTVVARAAIMGGVWRTRTGKALVLSIGIFLFESLFQHGSQLRILYMLLGMLLAYSWAMQRAAREQVSG